MEIRSYGSALSLMDVPSLVEMQRKFYAEFLQAETLPEERVRDGLQAVLEETFPITSYDESVSLEFLEYELGEPRHTPEECRKLGLTYGAPLKIKVRLNRVEEPLEEDVYLGTMPLMLGGGEFIINGAERVVVTQIQRSPGTDFDEEIHASGKRLHSCRIIPERGSWIQVEVTAKDQVFVRIDRSSKIPGTTLLRALDAQYSTTADILRAFYREQLKVYQAPWRPDHLRGCVLVSELVDPRTGEVLGEAQEAEDSGFPYPGKRLTDEDLEKIREAGLETVEVIPDLRDELLLNTLAEDDSEKEARRNKRTPHEQAILKIYLRLRPGNPPHLEKALELFREMFFDEKRYNFGKIGRFRLNRKFGSSIPEEVLVLTSTDYFHILQYLLRLRAGDPQAQKDDIDHLANRRVRTIKDLVMDEFRRGMLKLRRSVRERLSLKDTEAATPRALINGQTVASAIEYFFARGELSQVVDQSNPLAQLTHERRLSALGPGGLNRKRAGFEVRDVHPSHYGRICPIETPEGTNIGLIVSLSIYAAINDYGFVVTPYAVVKNRQVTDEVVWLRADEEREHYIAQADTPLDDKRRLTKERVDARHQENFVTCAADQVDLMDVSTKQLVGVAAALIPFLEHDDANRALMGSNMQRQAVPLLRPEVPIVATGMEPYVAANSGMMECAEEDGEVVYADSLEIRTRNKGGEKVYPLRKYIGLNERTCLNQNPLVKAGDRVKKGQLLTEGAAIKSGELTLGRNVLVAFMSWEGTNFEDAILVSESLLRRDSFTSVHIEEFQIEIRETKLGREEITRDIPNVGESALRHLDDGGLIRIGVRVEPGDILVGKIAPKSKSELSSEEKLLHAIFGRAGEDVKNDSLEVKPGVEGYVIDVQRFARTSPVGEDERQEANRLARETETEYNERIVAGIEEKFQALREIVGGPLVDAESGVTIQIDPEADPQQVMLLDRGLDLGKVEMHPSTRRRARICAHRYDKMRRRLEVEKERQVGRIKRGDELPAGVRELVKVYVAVKRRLSVGDKMAGRHGNKGVISRILPEEDMPFLEDGTPVEMVLNPLGVPSRMNFGQILETHLGWAAHRLGFRAISPPFDGCKEPAIRELLVQAGLPPDGKVWLYDGRTGERFEQKVTVGYIYMMKLHHLVADKVHARATGPYSLITQQPLGGKARSGGQRFGEMEVWALEAYGAANVLQELLTVKADDVEGRTKIYESMVKGENSLEPGTPVSFDVLCNEIKGLGLNIKLEKRQKSVL